MTTDKHGEYQCCVTNALTLQAGPPPVASIAASYLRRNSFGSESPSYCGRMTGLMRGVYWSSSNSTERGVGAEASLLWPMLLLHPTYSPSSSSEYSSSSMMMGLGRSLTI